jgi:hypothetical protein
LLKPGEQVIGAEAAFFGALKIMNNLATMHHDEAVTQAGGLMHGMRDRESSEFTPRDDLFGEVDQKVRAWDLS